MKSIILIIITIVFVIPSIGYALDESPVKFMRDPFKRPAILNIRKSKPQARPIKKATIKKTVAQETKVKLKLRATLVDGHKSMANINGTMMMIGDVIDGYRLLRVQERMVFLEKNDKKVTLTIEAQ